MPIFRVGKPRLKLVRTAALTGVTGDTFIPWQAVDSEEGPSMWSSLTPTDIVLQKTGLWSVVASAHRQGIAVPTDYRLHLFVNGTSRTRIDGLTTAEACGWTVAMLEPLAAGDVIKVQVRGATAPGVATINEAGTFVALARVGPERWTG